MSAEQATIDSLTSWVAQTTPEGHGLLLPISGGSDSALASYICGRAVGNQATGLYFGESLRCQDWFEEQTPVELATISDDTLDPEAARWAHVVTRAIAQNRIIVGTRNRTEDVLGAYSTASKVAAMLPLVGVWKTDIIALCEHIGVPQEIIESSKQADADCGRPEELAALSFEQVDSFLKVKIGELPTEAEVVMGNAERAYLDELYARNSFKSLLPYLGPQVVTD